jgi:hypothetical protein
VVGVAYRGDRGLGLTLIVGDGVVTGEDWRALVSRTTSDPEWPVGRLGLTDLSSADTSAVTGGDVCEMATAFRGHGSKVSDRKAAIVAGDTAYGNAVTFQQTIGPIGLRIVVFSHLDVACEWLGISIEDVTPTVEELRREIRRR